MRPLLALPIVLPFLFTACRSTDDAPPSGPWQTERDERLRYELLEPSDNEFLITYELSATTPGATTYCTPVRGDTFVSEVTAENVDTGAKLDVALVGGKDARKRGHPGADPSGSYFLVALDRPVPEHGELRLALHAKYEDRVSFTYLGEECLFARLLAVPEVAVVLPPKHALVECNVPARVRSLEDGRIELAYEKRGRVPLPLRVVARRVEGDLESPPALRVTPPFAVPPRRGLEHEVEVEFDVARRRLAWRHDLACASELDAAPLVTLAPHALEPTAHVRTTGDVLAGGIAEASLGAPRAIVWDGAQRIRLEAATAVEVGGRNVRLEFDAAPLSAIVLPPGWTPRAASLPLSTVPLPDGRTRLELGHGPVGFEGLLLELWHPAPPMD